MTDKEQDILDKKTQVATKFLFKLYEIITGNKIDKLEDFKDVKSKDFKNIDAIKLFSEMEDEIYPPFDKKESSYYKRYYAKLYINFFEILIQ